jgi:hypothetical protein
MLIARFDTAQGRYEVLGYGLPVPWRDDYARLLRQRYGIRFRPVAGCIVSEELRSYVEGYNKVSGAAAERKFGNNIFSKTADEAFENWKRSTHAEIY